MFYSNKYMTQMSETIKTLQSLHSGIISVISRKITGTDIYYNIGISLAVLKFVHIVRLSSSDLCVNANIRDLWLLSLLRPKLVTIILPF